MSRKTNLNRKKLIIIAFFIIVLLIILIIMLGRTRSLDKGNVNFAKQMEMKSNTEKLIDYDEPVMKYGNDIFILDQLSHAIIKYNLKNNTKSIIINFGNADYSDQFFIRSNQLVFSYNNVTYYSDLNGNNIRKLTNGEVVFMNDDVYLFVVHQETRDELYIVSYDYKTFRTTTTLSHNVANGKTIQYLKTVGNNIYFTSLNSNEKLILFEVNVNDSSTRIISSLSSNADEYGTINLEISDVLKDDDNYFYVIKEMTPTTDEGSLFNYSYLYTKSIAEMNEEIIAENVGIYLAQNNKNKILYEQKMESGDSIWIDNQYEETEYTWKNLRYGDVTDYFSIENSAINRDTEKFVDLGMNLSEYTLKTVIRLDDGYYFLIASNNEHSWYHCTENGENLVKIN